MAKKSSSRSRRGRDTSRVANSRPFYTRQPELPLGLPKLTEIEDRRTFHPMGEARPARSFRTSRHRLVVAPETRTTVSRPDKVPDHVAFHAPREVLICVRRKNRKQVLHALGKTGKVGQKRPRRNFYSDVRCK